MSCLSQRYQVGPEGTSIISNLNVGVSASERYCQIGFRGGERTCPSRVSEGAKPKVGRCGQQRAGIHPRLRQHHQHQSTIPPAHQPSLSPSPQNNEIENHRSFICLTAISSGSSSSSRTASPTKSLKHSSPRPVLSTTRKRPINRQQAVILQTPSPSLSSPASKSPRNSPTQEGYIPVPQKS